ncbi:MAG: hypothetical protein WB507_04925 [Solirubrobacterales bacterium]
MLTCRLSATGVVAVVLGLLLFSSPAFAARTYTGHRLTGFTSKYFEGPSSIAIDGSDNVWGLTTNIQRNRILAEFGPYPSEFEIPHQWDPKNHLSGISFSNFAIDYSTGDIYFSESRESNPYNVVVFSGSGEYKQTWEAGEGKATAVSVDNSGGPTQSDVIVSQGNPASIQAFTPDGAPLNFSSSEEYVHGNKITGTPFGEFFFRDLQTCGCGAQLMPITTDASGNIYVSNGGVVYEFEPSGTFVRRFTGVGAPGGFACGYSCSGPSWLAVDPTNGNLLTGVDVEEGGSHLVIDEFTPSGEYVPGSQIQGLPIGPHGEEVPFQGFRDLAINSEGYLYVSQEGAYPEHYGEEHLNAGVYIFGPAPQRGPKVTNQAVSELGQTSGTLNARIEPKSGEVITSCQFAYSATSKFQTFPCSPNPAEDPPASYFNGPNAVSVSTHISGLSPELPYHYHIVLTNSEGKTFEGPRGTYTPHFVVGIETKDATGITDATATLHAAFTGNGESTTYYFEYGPGPSYGNKTSPITIAPTGPTEVQAEISGLGPVTVYDFRLVAKNSGLSHANNLSFKTLPLPPVISGEVSTAVHSDSAVLHVLVNPGGGHTSYRFEYGTTPCSSEPDTCTSLLESEIGTGFANLSASTPLSHLERGTTYYWRVVATNASSPSGGTPGAEQTFNTFPYLPIIEDPCPNAHVRQQTGAVYLLDCRAYELVSAANAGGYDVESNLVAGQTPFAGFPLAETPPRVLYGVNDGGIPGTNHPTNKGIDPYVATRGTDGWTTEYVGVPSDNPFSAAPFSSTPSGADATLDTFAFGALGGCSPCFEGGYASIPLRVPGHPELIPGMIGPEEPGPGAASDGRVVVPLSADGDHFIFGSTSKFAAGGNNDTGDVSIYDRNLATGETHVVSDNPNGEPLPCLKGPGKCDTANKDPNGIAELDISADGSRILIGQRVSEEKGTIYWRLFMDINDAEKTIELTPGATHGVIYHGMTSDGSEVFFTTNDALTTTVNQDTDTSVDLYEAEVSESTATVLRLSTGSEGTGNTNACEPVANATGKHWNSLESTPNCAVLAVGGNGGVASEAGSVYFVSPEQLETGKGVLNQPNLYVVAPGGSPRFVATLNPNDQLIIDSLKEPEVRHTADFQVTPSGRFAALSTVMPLTGYANGTDTEIFRYDAAENQIVCASCDPTNAEATAGASLAANGLSLTEKGQIFFNSTDALAPHDLDEVKDVYEWEPQGTGDCEPEIPNFNKASGSCTGLISTGTSPFPSGLLSASASGTDVYFFTRDTLVPQDKNGELVKIYDARVEGGFPYLEPQPLCKASDECHGAGTPAPPPPQVGSTATPGKGNEEVVTPTKPGCKPGFVRKHGHCVRRPKHPHESKAHRGGKKR